MDWALELSGVAKCVVLVHKYDRFQAHEANVRHLPSECDEIYTFHEVKALHGDERIEAVTIFDDRTGEETTIDVDALVLNIGMLANLGPIREWGLEVVKNAIRVDSHMRTNIPGVFAAGDIVTYPGKIRLIATGTGDAAIAVNHAKSYVCPQEEVFGGFSSSKKAPSIPIKGVKI